MKRINLWLSAAFAALLLSVGCGCGGYATIEPPPLQVEVKPAPPGPKAVWIDGHWKWHGGRYVWVDGHWDKNPKGAWVPGHWAKKPRGHVWVPGHWKK